MSAKKKRTSGLQFTDHFTQGVSPFDRIEWQERDIRVKDHATGKVIWSQDRFRVPSFWSENAGTIVASKYAFGPEGAREQGVDEVINRVANAITDWGITYDYFRSGADAKAFRRELKHLCVHQYGAFNSPVWFNVGINQTRGLKGTGTVWRFDPDSSQPKTRGMGPKGRPVRTTESYTYPQTSACFIQSVEDSMESLMGLATSEAMLFKHGSGTGTDFTTIRSKRERLSTGGVPSGPISFMKIYDRIASTVKSGGKTRRAAKMQTMGCWHPDILDFIRAKGSEEKKAHLLIKGGMDPSFNGEAYDTVAFQNANFTVRYTDAFMGSLRLRQIGYPDDWSLKAVTTGETIETIDPRVIWDAMAEETWRCGDPGAQFADTINAWHTCPNTAPINSSNPCSEYLFIDDSACNLASLRLTRFYRDGKFDIAGFRQAVRVFVVAQDILVDMGSYPTEKICQNQHDYRTLGLGFADLGGLLMRMGVAYDSDLGRTIAGGLAALLTGEGYAVSSQMAAELGPFVGFEANKAPMQAVMEKHQSYLSVFCRRAEKMRHDVLDSIMYAAVSAWGEAIPYGWYSGYRNAQISVIAPTGTIAFMMDCDTTGIEPALGLVTYKTLAGGGNLVLVNDATFQALHSLGYAHDDRWAIRSYISAHGHAVGCDLLKPEHLPVFDTALSPKGSGRTISWNAHLEMMAHVQPFISGAISKTVNVPEDFTVKQIADAYYRGYILGLKCVAIYRDKSKGSQPVTVDKPREPETEEELFDAIEAVEREDARSVPLAAGIVFHPTHPERCVKCNYEVLVTAGTCAICPACGEPQGGCS